jgi:Novel STAND NTPase 1
MLPRRRLETGRSLMPDSPYAGLNPFSVKDAPFFFGRDHERDLIVANLMASRLTVLYGPSGVGKSSVLNAGALNALRHTYGRLAADGKPQIVAVAFQKWQTNPAAELTRWLTSSLDIPADGTLPEKLAAWSTRRGGRLLLMLDQFEEYLLYHERANDEFGELLPQILKNQTLAVNVLLSLREDSVARLDAFKGRVPNLFQNYLRLDRLTRDAARAAIEGPLDRFNQLGLSGDHPVTIEPALVDAVLADVRTGRLTIGEAGRGRVKDAGALTEELIETPYLQLVMKRLWEEEQKRHSDVILLSTYQRLGGAQRIVENHLDDTVHALSRREQAVAASIFEHLVTPTKSKIAHTSSDLANYAHVDEQQITALLDKLSGPERILAPVAPTADQTPETRYQIFHDVLAPAVLAWTTKHHARLAQRRRIFKLAGGLALLTIVVALGVLLQRTNKQARLIELLQRNSKDIVDLMKIQTDLSALAARNRDIESQVAKLEQEARDAKATQLVAALAEVRKNVGDVADKNTALAQRADRVGTSLETNQRQIAAVSGASAAAAEDGVKAALQRYAYAYSALDVGQVAAIYPTFSDLGALEQSFKGLSSYNLVVTPTGPVQLSDDLLAATVTCSLTGTIQPKVGKQMKVPAQTKVFYLRRRDSGWVIVRTNP